MKMNKIYFSSDLHLGHDRLFIYGERGFATIQEMNEAIIRNFNSIVDDDDDLYLLGDCVLGDLETGLAMLKQLRGRVHIILGNHDTDKRVAAYEQMENVVEVVLAKKIKYRKYHFYLSHYPTMTGNLEAESLHQVAINLYGHTHQKTNFYNDIPFMYHVGVDSHECKPILLDDIIEECKAKVQECKEFLDEEV